MQLRLNLPERLLYHFLMLGKKILNLKQMQLELTAIAKVQHDFD